MLDSVAKLNLFPPLGVFSPSDVVGEIRDSEFRRSAPSWRGFVATRTADAHRREVSVIVRNVEGYLVRELGSTVITQ